MDDDTVRIDDIISSGGIGRLLGVGQPAVSNWKARHEDFPAPFFVEGKKLSLYRKSEVLAWYVAQYPERAEHARLLARALYEHSDH